MYKFKQYLNEVEKELKSIPVTLPPDKWRAESYIGGGTSRFHYLNLKVPKVRGAFKNGFSFSVLSPKEQWPVWNYIWQNSEIFEVKLLASYWVASRSLSELIECADMIFKWVEEVDNWAFSDELSSHYSKILESNPKKYLPQFDNWSKSKNPWLRRQSIVGLHYYSRARKKHLPLKTVLKFVERQMDYPHYYVEKGVGWTLRECWNLYPSETYSYIKKNAGRIGPGGWTAATEKLPKKQKQELLFIRKKTRQLKKKSS